MTIQSLIKGLTLDESTHSSTSGNMHRKKLKAETFRQRLTLYPSETLSSWAPKVQIYVGPAPLSNSGASGSSMRLSTFPVTQRVYLGRTQTSRSQNPT